MKKDDISNFPLCWRWTSKKHRLLTPDELKQIQPLTQSSAKNAAIKSSTYYSDELQSVFNEEMFKSFDFIDTLNFQLTSEWLKRKMNDSEIVVSWDENTAVLTNTTLFVKYWDDFCYPSSDDVSVWPLDERWVIRYFHSESFGYGRAV